MGRAKKLHLEQDLSFPGFDGNLSLAAAMQPASVATIVIADAEPGAAPGLAYYTFIGRFKSPRFGM